MQFQSSSYDCELVYKAHSCDNWYLAATMLGFEEAPPAHAQTAEKTCDPSDMTFAYGGSGVFDTTSAQRIPNLAKQVDTFKKMVQDGTISEQQLSRSVALVAISGNDYYASTGVTGLATPNDVSS